VSARLDAHLVRLRIKKNKTHCAHQTNSFTSHSYSCASIRIHS
jgi:hypothetical protein